jgi:hypothetical protein
LKHLRILAQILVIALLAACAGEPNETTSTQPTLSSVMVSGETTGDQQSFFSSENWIKNTAKSVDFGDFAENPSAYMREGIAYDVLRRGVAIKLGRDGLSDSEFKTLLQQDYIGTRRCEGTIVTTGIDPVTGDAFWFTRACYANETIVYANTKDGKIDLFSLGCGNLIDGPLYVPAPKPVVMNDDNFIPTPPVCVGVDCTPPPVCEGSDCPPPPVCVGDDCLPPPECVGSDCPPPPVCEGSDCPPPPTPAGKCNNGWGNNGQCAPGNSLEHNNAENREGAREDGTNNPNGMAQAPGNSGSDSGNSANAPGQQGQQAADDAVTVDTNNANGAGNGNGNGNANANANANK